MVATVGAREFGLFVGAHGADDGGADGLRPLAGDEADASGGGVEEDGVARLHLAGAVQEILHGHALEHHRGSGLVVDPVGDSDNAGGGYEARLGIGAHGRRGVGDAVARSEIGDIESHGLHRAGGFEPRREGALGNGIEAAAVIGVDVVEADRGVTDADLAGAGLAEFDLFPLHDLRAAGVVGADCTAVHDLTVLPESRLRGLGSGSARRRSGLRAQAERVSRRGRRSSRRVSRRRP